MECIICSSKEFSKLPFIREVSKYTHKSYPLYKCKNCGLIRPYPLPYHEDNKLGIYDNPENIRYYNAKEKIIEDDSFEYKYYFKYFRPFIQLIDKYKIKGKSLDIGCGAGHLLKLLSEKGFDSEGLDVSRKLINALKNKFKVYCCDINDKRLKEDGYNLITSNQVLEHIENPEKFVKRLNKLLVKGGYTIIAVPYLKGLVPNILRTKWYGLGYGQHLNFFSKKSLKIMFERNGFEICEIKILIVNYDHPKFPRFINLFAEILSGMIVSINMGDNLFLIARKIK